MVATFARLKLTILKNSFKRSPWQLVGMILGLLYGLTVLSLLVIGLIFLRFTDIEVRARVLIVVGAVAILGWWLIPLLMGRLDQTINPQKMVQFPLKPRQVLAGITVAGLIGTPGLITVILFGVSVAVWTSNALATFVAILGVVLALLLSQFGARCFASFSTFLWNSRKGAEIGGMILILVFSLSGFLIAFVANSSQHMFATIEDFIVFIDQLKAVLGWTPLGAPFAAPFDAAQGLYVEAIAKLGIVIVTIVLFGWVWMRLNTVMLSNPPQQKAEVLSKESFLDRLATNTRTAIMVRTFKYWKRDSRLAVSNVMILVLPVLFIALGALGIFDFGEKFILSLGLIMGFLYGWGLHNMLAYDGTAYWVHIAASVRGKDDRLGRLYAEGFIGFLLITVIAVVTTLVAGFPEYLGLTVLTSWGVLLTFIGISNYISPVWMYPVPKAGGNPFETPSGAGGLMAAVQMVSMLVGGLILSPVIVLYILFLLEVVPVWTWTIISGLSLLIGVVILLLGIKLGGNYIDRKNPEIMQRLEKYA